MAAIAAREDASASRAEWNELYERRHKPLFRFFYRMTGRQTASEDLTHEVFVRMIRYRKTYAAGDQFEAWMYRIARNVAADFARKHRAEFAAAEGQMEQIESGHPTPHESAVKKQNLAMLHKALRLLSEEKRELIVLSRFQGLTYEQIGRIKDCEPGAAKVRVFRAVREMGQVFHGLLREKAS